MKSTWFFIEIHGCGQDNAIYDLASEMAEVEGSIHKELEQFRNQLNDTKNRVIENNKRVRSPFLKLSNLLAYQW